MSYHDETRPDIPSSLRQLMAEIGPRWVQDGSPSKSVALMTAAFSEVHASSPDETSTVEADVAYGEHRLQRLDVYTPRAPATGPRPVVIFVHGGAFTEGQRNKTPHFYSNVLRFFARHGVLGVNMSYPLAPESQFPGASENVGRVVAWVKSNAAALGADPDRIFIMGHSAGGAHVGSYAYDKSVHPKSGPGIAGVIIISGRVRAETLKENPNARKVEAYYGVDQAALDRGSAVSHVGPDSPPTFIAVGEFENPLIDLHCTELAHRLSQAKRKSPPFLSLRGHNHTSTIGHLNTSENLLGQHLLDFIAHPV